MEPITRKEIYLAKISGDYSGTVPEPVTRMDYYMAYAAGTYNGPLPRPITQQEIYWAYICGITDIRLPDPITRIDIYLAAICGSVSSYPPPITREEIYLSRIAKQNQYVIKSAAGKQIVLTDSLEAPFEDFKVYGRSEQRTTTGAQLYNVTAVGGPHPMEADPEGYYTLELDNTHGTNVTYKNLSILPSGLIEAGADYLIVAEVAEIENALFCPSSNPAVNADYFVGQLPVPTSYPSNTNVAGTQVFSATAQDDLSAADCMLRTFLRVDPGQKGHCKVRLSVIKNTTITAETFQYEPYTGGQPSPNPEYPQPIYSVGDEGNVAVEVMGKNLLDMSKVYAGRYRAENNGEIIDTSSAIYRCFEIELPKGNYTVCFNVNVFIQALMASNGKITSTGTNNNITYKTFSLSEKSALRCNIRNTDIGTNWDDVNNMVWLVPGIEPVSYEPYRTPQSLTLSTPNGLPGVPVASGGNYTDENGQQWVCDEIDFERGVYVQRIKKKILDGSEKYVLTSITTDNVQGIAMNSGLYSAAKVDSLMFCNFFQYDRNESTENSCRQFNSEYGIRFSVSINILPNRSIEEWTEYLLNKYELGNPVIIQYILDTPIETSIPAAELATYQALYTNYPTTTITNDEDCWMQVGYRAKKGSL